MSRQQILNHSDTLTGHRIESFERSNGDTFAFGHIFGISVLFGFGIPHDPSMGERRWAAGMAVSSEMSSLQIGVEN